MGETVRANLAWQAHSLKSHEAYEPGSFNFLALMTGRCSGASPVSRPTPVACSSDINCAEFGMRARSRKDSDANQRLRKACSKPVRQEPTLASTATMRLTAMSLRIERARQLSRVHSIRSAASSFTSALRSPCGNRILSLSICWLPLKAR